MLAEVNIKAVLSELGTELDISDLQFDENKSCFVAFDGQVVNIQMIRDWLYLTTHVATLPNETPLQLYEALLQANLYGGVTGGATIAFEPESRAVLLQDRMEGEVCSKDRLVARLEAILSAAKELSGHIEAL